MAETILSALCAQQVGGWLEGCWENGRLGVLTHVSRAHGIMGTKRSLFSDGSSKCSDSSPHLETEGKSSKRNLNRKKPEKVLNWASHSWLEVLSLLLLEHNWLLLFPRRYLNLIWPIILVRLLREHNQVILVLRHRGGLTGTAGCNVQ